MAGWELGRLGRGGKASRMRKLAEGVCRGCGPHSFRGIVNWVGGERVRVVVEGRL